jgi:hypothetical protein
MKWSRKRKIAEGLGAASSVLLLMAPLARGLLKNASQLRLCLKWLVLTRPSLVGFARLLTTSNGSLPRDACIKTNPKLTRITG